MVENASAASMQARCARTFFRFTNTKPATRQTAAHRFISAFCVGSCTDTSPSGQKAHFVLDHGFAGLALLGLLEQAPDVRSQEVDLARHVLLAAETPHVVGLRPQDARVLGED